MTTLRTLLLHVSASGISPRRLQLIKRLADEQGAGIEAVYAVTPALVEFPFSLTAEVLAAEQLVALEAEARDAARAALDRDCLAAGMPSIAWRAIDGDPVRGLRRQAWRADMLVLGQHQPDAAVPSAVPADFVASVLVSSGKPGLVLPYIDQATVTAKTVLVAWKPRPESARATTAALPLLQRAGQVHLACWDDAAAHGSDLDAGMQDDGDTAAPALQFLQRHGINAIVHREGPPSADLGELLLSQAADLQADLLVMGCYGHGRAREWVLGGVTRTILNSMTLPVLMVH